jgi:CRISPR/Cas system CSM-associated protein Csm2 small subunit
MSASIRNLRAMVKREVKRARKAEKLAELLEKAIWKIDINCIPAHKDHEYRKMFEEFVAPFRIREKLVEQIELELRGE